MHRVVMAVTVIVGAVAGYHISRFAPLYEILAAYITCLFVSMLNGYLCTAPVNAVDANLMRIGRA